MSHSLLLNSASFGFAIQDKLGQVGYLVLYKISVTKTWEEGYQLIKAMCFGLDIK